MAGKQTVGEASDDKVQQDLADFEKGVVGRDGDVDTNDYDREEPEEQSGQADQGTTETVDAEASAGVADSTGVPVANTYLIPDEEVFGKFRGQKLTAAQIDKEGLLEKYQTWGLQSRNKISAADKANAEMMKRIEEMEKRVAESAPERAPAEITPELVRTELKKIEPMAREWAKAYGEEDFIEAYPVVGTMLFYQVQRANAVAAEFYEKLNILASAVVPLAEGRRDNETTASMNDARSRIEASAVSLAKKEPVMSGLADDAHRAEFFEWIVSERNPLSQAMAYLPAEALNEDALRRLYYAYLADAQEIMKRAPASDRRLAAGGSGGSGGGSGPRTGFAAELEEFERGVVRSF